MYSKCLVLTWTLFCICAVVSAAEAPSVDPLARRIDIDLPGQDLGEAIKQLAIRGKVDFLVGLDVARPEEFDHRILYLQLRNATLYQCSDWIARALGTRYRITDGGRTVEFTSSYLWLDKVSPVHNFRNLGGVIDWEEREPFMAALRELLKVHALRPEYSLALKQDDRRLQAILAPELHSRLGAILRVMANSPRMPRMVKLSAERGREALEEALQRPVRVDYEKWPLSDVLADLAFQSDLNIAFDHVPFFDSSMPQVTLAGGEVTLREALSAVCAATPLARWLVEPPGSLWLTTDKGACEYTGTRRLLWEDVPVVAYAAGKLLETMKPEELVNHVRACLPQDILGDPSAAVVCHQPSGMVIVIAPMRCQELAERALAELERK